MCVRCGQTLLASPGSCACVCLEQRVFRTSSSACDPALMMIIDVSRCKTFMCDCSVYIRDSQDPDYCVEIEADHPEFRKLAFTSPGPKNAFAPLQRSCYGRQPHLPQPHLPQSHLPQPQSQPQSQPHLPQSQSQPGGAAVKREEADTVATVTATMSEGRLASLSRERL